MAENDKNDRDGDCLGKLSMHPLSLEDALRGLLETPLPEDEQKGSGPGEGAEKKRPKKKASKKKGQKRDSQG